MKALITDYITHQKQAESKAININAKYQIEINSIRDENKPLKLRFVPEIKALSSQSTTHHKMITKEYIENSFTNLRSRRYYEIRDKVTNFKKMLDTSKHVVRYLTDTYESDTANSYCILKAKIDQSSQVLLKKKFHSKLSHSIYVPQNGSQNQSFDGLQLLNRKVNAVLPPLRKKPPHNYSVLKENIRDVCTPKAEKLLTECLTDKTRKPNPNQSQMHEIITFTELCKKKKSLTLLKDRILGTIKNERKRSRLIRKFFDSVSKGKEMTGNNACVRKSSNIQQTSRTNLSSLSVNKSLASDNHIEELDKRLSDNKKSLHSRLSAIISKMNPLISLKNAADKISESRVLLNSKLYKNLYNNDKMKDQILSEKKKLLWKEESLSTNVYNLPYRIKVAIDEKMRVVKEQKKGYMKLLHSIYKTEKNCKVTQCQISILNQIKDILDSNNALTEKDIAKIISNVGGINTLHAFVKQIASKLMLREQDIHNIIVT